MATTLFGQKYADIIGLCQSNSIMGMPIDKGSVYDDGAESPTWYGFTMNEGTVAFVVSTKTITGVQVEGPNAEPDPESENISQ